MYTLFYYPRNASWAPHMLLTDMGADFERVLVDRKSNEQKSDHYLKLNPTGRIPTLSDGNTVIFESAAICLYLCEQNPQAGLMPPAGSPERALFYQWLFYLTATLQPELMLYIYPEKYTTDNETQAISDAQEARLGDIFSLIDKELESKSFLVGDAITACDYFLFMLSHWASELTKPPLSYDHLGRYLRQLAQRPAVTAVCETEGTDLGRYL